LIDVNSKDYREELELFIEAGRNDMFRKICHATYAVKTADMFGREVIGVQYHNTVIFGIHEDGSHFINNGGYFTRTTQSRINTYLLNCGHGYNQIIQRNKRWLMNNVEFGRTASVLFDVDKSPISSNTFDCWAKPLREVEIKNSKITDYYLSKG